MKLFTIGDSISQAFMSGAAARTDLSYSTLIAQNLGIEDYHYPLWAKDGLPFNIETMLRRLERRLGSDVSGPIEWIRAASILNAYFDEIEDYYERGEGRLKDNYQEAAFHNVAVRGFDLAYTWLINSDLCKHVISNDKDSGDNWWGRVNQPLLRTAHRVLHPNQGQLPTNQNSQIDWLRYHHQREGVENVVLFLGANNALGTVVDLEIVQTSDDGSLFEGKRPDQIDYQTRIKSGWNLWHPKDFEVEYAFMLNKVIEVLENNPHHVDYKVFIGTVPLVTIAPITKAAGDKRSDIKVTEWPVDPNNPAPMGLAELSAPVEKDYSYGTHYPYFLFADTFKITDKHLNQAEIIHIDNVIRKYNRIIQEQVALANERVGARRFYLIDASTHLSNMAIKRNHANPTYKYPPYFEFVHPKVDIRYYGTDRKGNMKSGGFFSLDGVHPTAIGQGLIAWEFLKVMKQAGVSDAKPDALNWKGIFESDDLRRNPLKITQELYDNIDFKRFMLEKVLG